MANMAKGASGDSVRELQRLLAAQGFPLQVDGIFGQGTEDQVRELQRKFGLSADGIAGAETMEVLLGGPVTDIPDRDHDPDQAGPKEAKSDWPRQGEVPGFYGGVGKNQASLALPFPMRIAWDKAKTIRAFSIHEKVHDSAKRCFERIANAYADEQRRELGLDLFGGCLNVRTMRGGSRPSMHSWGIAIDFDPERNQLKWKRDRARLAKPDAEAFWKIWEDEGWVSLGRASNFDWMHVQAARL